MNVPDYRLSLRSQALGMLKAGETPKKVDQVWNVNIRSVQRWGRGDKLRFSMESKPKSEQPPKIAIAKSLGKRRQSTRKLALRLTRRGCDVSHTSVHRYLRSL
ncbi:hypothetical protein LOD99_8791 [Oopsacas minuta]|uniref:Transposase n=1 Tax=Oopsacas minuta TaxID=111878 RepID=A0AAV7JGG2_9METZ|nr:hypothetical protein LOD99_8791 [Oopsacas minuta]